MLLIAKVRIYSSVNTVVSFIKNANLELDRWNGIKVNANYQTSNPKIYAGGDGVRGADLAVRAAADGKLAAENIIRVLLNK